MAHVYILHYDHEIAVDEIVFKTVQFSFTHQFCAESGRVVQNECQTNFLLWLVFLLCKSADFWSNY